jgi:hypothetical protein
MSIEVQQLVEALEQLDLDSAQADTERLASLVLERQEILGRLQKADVLTLAPDARAALGARIKKVLARDEALLSRLVQIREKTRESLENLQQGKSATRGYAKVSIAPTESTKRVG